MTSVLSLMEASGIAGCIILLAVGIVLVVKGGDWFVDAASWIAEVSGIPTFIIGATIVSLATTLPEILVSSIAASQGSAGLAIGNAVGSVNCNIALIMAISLIFIPAAFKRKDYVFKMALLLAGISVLWAVSASGSEVVWWEGLIVLLVFLAFMVENILSAKRHTKQLELSLEGSDLQPKPVELGNGVLRYVEENRQSKRLTIKRSGMVIEKKDIGKNIFMFIFGAACIVIGAQLMCDNGSRLAELAKVPEDIIGVTILAVGTSLPELVTTITSIVKKKADLSIGNIIGANVIDISLILPLCSFIAAGKAGETLAISAQSSVIDFPFCLAVAAVAFVPALIMGRFKKWQGVLLLAGYAVYMLLLVLNTSGVISIFAV